MRLVHSAAAARSERPLPGALRCRRKFLRFFPDGFRDPDYVALERAYKWRAHLQWREALSRPAYAALLRAGRHREVAAHAVRIESRTNLLFSFEKMALRDAVRSSAGARRFAAGLYDLLHGPGGDAARFERWCDVVASLPRRQTRVLTWPIVTVFGFLAQPTRHCFLKPVVTKTAAAAYGLPFRYRSRPAWDTYAGLLDLVAVVAHDLRDLRPRDMMDLQSFVWVQGSSEYDE
jgi:hypothetical protein